MITARRIFYIFVSFNLIILNALIFYLIRNEATTENDLQITANEDLSDTQNVLTCLDDCKRYTDEQISQLSIGGEQSVPATPIPTSTPIPPAEKTPQISVSYIPIPGNGSILKTAWTTIPGTDFYMSKGDYPGLTEVYFEANMKLVNGNGKGYLRLFDATHSVAVDGSTIETQSQTSVAVGSGKINLWDGYNHYQVQAKSLTADTTVFESGRLKIITKN